MLSSFDTSSRFEQMIAETLMELAEIPTANPGRGNPSLFTLTVDAVDDVTVFEPMSRSLRSRETGQR